MATKIDLVRFNKTSNNLEMKKKTFAPQKNDYTYNSGE